MIVFGASSVALVAADFLRVGAPFAAALLGEIGYAFPREMLIGSLAVRHNGLGGAGTVTYTVRVGGADTALVLVLPAATASGVAESSTIVVPPNTLVSIRCNKAGLAASPTNIVATLLD